MGQVKIDEFKAAWNPILVRASELGVQVLFEPNIDQTLFNRKTTRAFCYEYEGTAPFGLCFDPANLLLVGENVDHFYQEFRSNILHVHVKNIKHAQSVEEAQFSSFRDGELNWKEILNWLVNDAYKGDYIIEFQDPQQNFFDVIGSELRCFEDLLQCAKSEKAPEF